MWCEYRLAYYNVCHVRYSISFSLSTHNSTSNALTWHQVKLHHSEFQWVEQLLDAIDVVVFRCCWLFAKCIICVCTVCDKQNLLWWWYWFIILKNRLRAMNIRVHVCTVFVKRMCLLYSLSLTIDLSTCTNTHNIYTQTHLISNSLDSRLAQYIYICIKIWTQKKYQSIDFIA